MRARSTREAEKNQLFVLSQFLQTRHVLFFYAERKDLSKLFRAVLSPTMRSGETAVYICPRERDRLKEFESYEGSKGFIGLPILDRGYKKVFPEDLEAFQARLGELLTSLGKGSRIRLLIDFQNTATSENVESIAALKKAVESAFGKAIVNQIYAFELGALDTSTIDALAGLGEKCVISLRNEYLLFSTIGGRRGRRELSIQALSKRELEERVRKSIDYIIYSLLQGSPCCGFDIIKSILLHFNVFLSQGTVYPILYELAEKGYLNVRLQKDNKTRLYSVTEEGRRFFRERLKSYVDAEEYVTGFIKAQMEV